METRQTGESIDVVIAWVDGGEPAFREKKSAYLTGRHEDKWDDIGGEARYIASGEICFCVASILRFAPFVRKIFIVTDNQNPGLDNFIARNFPGNTIPIEIVDHTVIFRGYEEYLPTFSSNSIEAMCHRIPGLSERYVYFNDDMMLAAPITPDMWYDGDRTVCYAEPFSTRVGKLLRRFKPKRHRRRPLGYKDFMVRSAELAGAKSFPYIMHSASAVRKSLLQEFYEAHPDALISCIRHKFRHVEQHNPQVLYYILALQRGECVMRPKDNRYFFLKPKPDRDGYIADRLMRAARKKNLCFGCINSFEQASPKEQEYFIHWMERRLDVKFRDE